MYVADRIYEIFQNENPGYDSFVILYRTNAQSRSFEEALRKLNLPYRIYGGLSFYQRKEIKDLIAYFRLSANHNDEESFKRVINYPARGIGKTTLNKLVVAAAENEQSIWDVISNFNTTSVGINKGTQKKLVDFQTMIHSFSAELETKSAFDLGYHIAKHTNILRSLHDDKTPEGVARYENIQELLNALKSFTDQVDTNHPDAVNTLSDFLVDVALLTDADLGSDDDDKISLMTVHAAKGLEFPFVFVVGLEENLFPSQLSVNSRSELEEERRLFYVALTRAMKEATMTYATTRYRWGNLIYCEPSRFLDELGDEFTERSEQAKFGKLDFSNERKSFNTTNTFKPRVAPGFKKVAKQATMEGFNPADSSEIETGMQVMHQRFGKGKVLNIEGVSPNQKATVFFPKIGQKQLLLRFAKLQIL
jgi:DNA helicase-2/ATP-dependent DNA helicase PcrA